jgi:murein DD-endopeptidase MepM/ murein hydrolase activator NlpD
LDLFRKYHIVIFKDREGGARNLRIGGWVGLLFFLLLFGLAGLSTYLWGSYARVGVLESELGEAHRIIRSHDRQVLSLIGKLQSLEQDITRVQQFDAKLRVMMNIDPADVAAEAAFDAGFADESLTASSAAVGGMSNPLLLSRHRELFMVRLHSLVDDLATSVRVEEVDQQILVGLLLENKDSLLSTPSIWPVRGFVTSGFGRRRSPLGGGTTMHSGIDISNRVGTPIRAPARGAVTFAGPDGAYGISITLDHGNGIVTRYAHLNRPLVKVGDYVQRGDVIGELGNTGRSTGPHLHYEVILNGTPVDPMRYILN